MYLHSVEICCSCWQNVPTTVARRAMYFHNTAINGKNLPELHLWWWALDLHTDVKNLKLVIIPPWVKRSLRPTALNVKFYFADARFVRAFACYSVFISPLARRPFAADVFDKALVHAYQPNALSCQALRRPTQLMMTSLNAELTPILFVWAIWRHRRRVRPPAGNFRNFRLVVWRGTPRAPTITSQLRHQHLNEAGDDRAWPYQPPTEPSQFITGTWPARITFLPAAIDTALPQRT